MFLVNFTRLFSLLLIASLAVEYLRQVGWRLRRIRPDVLGWAWCRWGWPATASTAWSSWAARCSSASSSTSGAGGTRSRARLAASALFAPLLVWWVLAPVRRVLPIIAQVGPQNLGQRIRPGRGRDEVKRPGRALDTMMDGIAAGYEGQRYLKLAGPRL